MENGQCVDDSGPPSTCEDDPQTPEDECACVDNPSTPANECACVDDPLTPQDECTDSDITADDADCETHTPNCSDMGAVECQILARTHRTWCQTLRETQKLEDFRDKQISEAKITNDRLNLIKEAITGPVVENLESLDDQQKKTKLAVDLVKTAVDGAKLATVEVKTAVENTKASVDEVKDATNRVKGAVEGVETTTNAVRTAVNNVKASTDDVKTGVSDLNSKTEQVRQGVLANTNATNQVKAAVADAANVIKDAIEAGQGDGTGHEVDWGDTGDPTGGYTAADADGASIQNISVGPGDIDSSGYLGRTCPVFPPLTVGGVAWDIDTVFWCQFLDVVYACMTLAGAVVAGRILLS